MGRRHFGRCEITLGSWLFFWKNAERASKNAISAENFAKKLQIWL